VEENLHHQIAFLPLIKLKGQAHTLFVHPGLDHSDCTSLPFSNRDHSLSLTKTRLTYVRFSGISSVNGNKGRKLVGIFTISPPVFISLYFLLGNNFPSSSVYPNT